MSVNLEIVLAKGKRKVRPLPNQSFKTDWFVQCDRGIRERHPIGTILKCDGLREMNGFYRAEGNLFVSLFQKEDINKKKQIKPSEKKTDDCDININELNLF